MSHKRSKAASQAREAVEIIDRGGYTAPSGAYVDLRALLDRAISGTRSYPQEHAVPPPESGAFETTFSVSNATTLDAASRLSAAGRQVAALNFASARHPGGGFLKGAQAQEESLARSSGLYACLYGHPMYPLHEGQRDPFYTDYVIFSPEVPVFRGADGALLERPYLCGFLTSPAVNAGVVRERRLASGQAIREAMARRVQKVLAVAAAHEQRCLVLGAWGCGVFRNEPEVVAELFAEALRGPCAGSFEHVAFAVLDRTPDSHFIGPFQRRFG